MFITNLDYTGIACRFKILVNGFPNGRAFASLREAQNSIKPSNVDDVSFEIYDTCEKRYVWTHQCKRAPCLRNR